MANVKISYWYKIIVYLLHVLPKFQCCIGKNLESIRFFFFQNVKYLKSDTTSNEEKEKQFYFQLLKHISTLRSWFSLLSSFIYFWLILWIKSINLIVFHNHFLKIFIRKKKKAFPQMCVHLHIHIYFLIYFINYNII